MKKFEIKKLTQDEEAQVETERQKIFQRMNSVPDDGTEVLHLGIKITVLKSVFWPRYDSEEVIRKMEIKKGEDVLDVCTGSGVIAVHEAKEGAHKVVALDINPEAVRNTELNAKKFGVENIIEARVSDLFSALKDNEKFDVITCNPPFSKKTISDPNQRFVEQSIKDEGHVLHKKFFETVSKYLKPGGKILMADANFGNVEEVLSLADKNGFEYELVGTNAIPNTVLIYYTFKFTRK
jgi:release factor glutamine methyltransferase